MLAKYFKRQEMIDEIAHYGTDAEVAALDDNNKAKVYKWREYFREKGIPFSPEYRRPSDGIKKVNGINTQLLQAT